MLAMRSVHGKLLLPTASADLPRSPLLTARAPVSCSSRQHGRAGRMFLRLARLRTLAVVLSGITLVASLAIGPAYAGPISASDPVTSSGMMPVASGTVTNPSGAAMPGETVGLYAWPSDSVLNALKVGKLIPTTLLATATTSGSGKY